ncbi:MAG: recombinase family protein, partial [bacterium]
MRDERHKVVGLIRVSTKEQADDDRAGIARQREVIAHTVLVKRLDLVSTIQLDDVSGTNVRHCSEIVELLSLVEKKNIQGVVLADLDRLLRPDRFEDFSLLQVFQDSGAILYCGDQEINLASDSGYLLAGVQALLSGNELRTIKRRINGAKEEKRKQGKCPNAAITIPTGVTYDRKAEKWGYTSEVVKVQEAFRLIDEENITNYRDLERKTGIHHRTLHNILRNPIYIGIRCIDKKRGTQKYASENGRQSDRKKVKRLPHEIIKVPVMEQPAVDPARFNRVQAILGNKKTSWSSSRSAPSQRLLTGVGHCAACGELLYCSSSAGKTRRQPGYYICRRNYYLYRPQTGGCPMKNIRQDKTDEAVIRWVAEKLTDRQVLDGILANYIGTQKSSNTESAQCVADVQEALDAIEQKRQRLNHGWLD